MAIAEDLNQTVDMHKMEINFNPKILKKKFNKNLIKNLIKFKVLLI